VLPAGAAEVAAECGHRSLVIGRGATQAAAALGGSVTACEAGEYRPAAWSAALAAALANEPIVVLPASPDGRDLAPRIAAVLDRPLFAGATSVLTDAVTVALGGGTTMSTVTMPASCVATLQVGARGVEPTVPDLELRHLALDLDHDGSSTQIDAEVVSILPPDAATIDLAEAPRIVAGGAGLDGPERFQQLAELGRSLGASVGATRVITDRGWVGHERQIGTTGVVVDPRLYLAFGISGAVQHTSGLGTPDHIVSINLDAHCPMMHLADLAVVGDANAVLDELIVQLHAENSALAGALAAEVDLG
jgi:electron transfer flavoprotein alpha subunit